VPRVFGYAATKEYLISWADRHNLCLDKPPQRRADNSLWKILNKLPEDLRRLVLIYPTKGRICACIVITTNKTREALQKASDKKLIELFQQAVDTKERPKWYPIADA